MMAGCYTLHLYCDNENHCIDKRSGPAEYCAELGTTCRRNARQRGWLIAGGRVLCPACSGKRPKPITRSRGSRQIDIAIDEAKKNGAKAIPVTELFKQQRMKVDEE